MPYRNLTLPAALAASLAVSCGPSAARAQTAAPDSTTEAAFMAENDAAMTMMMSGMSIKPTGDVDRDFATMMIAHHQGAIDMAQAELRHGTNEQLRRIAQEIVVDQIEEIAAMRLAVGDVLPPSFAAPTAMTMPAAMMHGAGKMTSSVTAK